MLCNSQDERTINRERVARVHPMKEATHKAETIVCRTRSWRDRWHMRNKRGSFTAVRSTYASVKLNIDSVRLLQGIGIDKSLMSLSQDLLART